MPTTEFPLDERYQPPAGGLRIVTAVFLGAFLGCTVLVTWVGGNDLGVTASREDRAILIAYAPVTLFLVTFLLTCASRALHQCVRLQREGRDLVLDLEGLPVLGRSTLRFPLDEILRVELALERRSIPGPSLQSLRLTRRAHSGRLTEEVAYLVPRPDVNAAPALRDLARAFAAWTGWSEGQVLRDDSDVLEIRIAPAGVTGPNSIPGRWIAGPWNPGERVRLELPVSSLQGPGRAVRELGRMLGAFGGAVLGYHLAEALTVSLRGEIFTVGGTVLVGAWLLGWSLDRLVQGRTYVDLDWGARCVRVGAGRGERVLPLASLRELDVKLCQTDNLLEAVHDPVRTGEVRGVAMHRAQHHSGRLRWHEVRLRTDEESILILQTATLLGNASEPEALRRCCSELARALKLPIRG